MLNLRRLAGHRPQIPVTLLTHPFELALGWALIANGVRAVFGDVTPSLAELPGLLQVFYFTVSCLGGTGLVVALTAPQGPASRRPTTAPIPWNTAVERAALFLVTAAYAVLAIMVVGNNPSRGLGYATVVGIVALGCVLRIVAIRRTTRAVMRSLRLQRAEVTS